jgi:hypothetical protein
MRELDRDGRLTLILANESRRMREAAERVDLVVRAMALRRGVKVPAAEEPAFLD